MMGTDKQNSQTDRNNLNVLIFLSTIKHLANTNQGFRKFQYKAEYKKIDLILSCQHVNLLCKGKQ